MKLKLREERKPILEDDDPFARPSAFSSLPSPRSPLPFSSLLALGRPKMNSTTALESILSTQETVSRISVASEPVTPRKPIPSTRHAQCSEYASTTNTTGGSQPSSYLFRSAPFPPTRDLENVTGQLLPRSVRESAPSPPDDNTFLPFVANFRKDSFDEFDRSSSDCLGPSSFNSSEATSVAAVSPRIHLSRSTADPLFPGSSFPFLLTISPLGRPPTPSVPLLLSISFVGYTSATTSCTSTHLLFELIGSIELTESIWKGNVSIPVSSACLSCGTIHAELPWSFYHREEDGQEWETKYEIVASCEGLIEGRMEIAVGARLSDVGSTIAKLSNFSIIEDIKGWKLESEPKLAYRIVTIDGTELPVTLDPSTRIAIQLSLDSRFLPTSRTADLDLLISAISPARASISLRAVVRNGTTGEPVPLGASWRNREDAIDFRLMRNGDEAVIVSHGWIVDARAVALARMSSCAGFAVEFELEIRFKDSRASSQTFKQSPVLKLVTPFIPFAGLSSPTSESSVSPPRPIPPTATSLPTELPRTAFFIESPSIAEKGETARRRWAKLRRIFSIR